MTFEVFSDQGRRILAQSIEYAKGHNQVELQHIFLAMLYPSPELDYRSSPTYRALNGAGMRFSSYRALLTDIDPLPQRTNDSGRMPFTREAKDAIRGAVREARKLFSEIVEPHHLLLAILHLLQESEVNEMAPPVLMRLLAIQGIEPIFLLQSIDAQLNGVAAPA